MKLIYALPLLSVIGCGRQSPYNYHCDPALLEQIDAKAVQCAKDSKVMMYAECLNNLKMAFCKYEN